MIGKQLGQYHVLEKIGAGGMGEVYRARDARLQRDVAIKVLPAGLLADEPARRRFAKEALALSKLNHPNIETVHAFDTQDGVDFLVLEYIPGVTLDEKLARGALPEKEVARLGMQLAEGLAAAHEQGVVHRDLKPGNLRVTPDGRLKILDFGLARLLRPADTAEAAATESLTQTQAVAGTLPYMAPEQLRGEPVDTRADIWAAGAVLYEMATGRRPFEAKLVTALAADIQTKPVTPPSQLNARISPRLQEIILKCLEKDPENRYQSAKELVVDLRRLTAPVAATATPHRWPLRWTVATGIAAVVLLATVIGLNVGEVRQRLFGGLGAGRIESLAVLPLANLSADPEQDYFADGMTEALITDLAKIGALKVISRTSVMQYKGVKKPLPQIAKELNVDAVVEGSVQRAGDRVRITAQLIEAVTDRNLWAESYERDLRDILTLQSEVAQAIAREIKVKLTPQEHTRLAQTRRVDPEVYDLYLKGRYSFAQRGGGTSDPLERAIKLFEQAIQKDPTYAPAYAGLADCYTVIAFWGYADPKEALAKAKAAAERALELDDSLAEAHASLAYANMYLWNFAAAERGFERAIELKPSYGNAHHWYSHLLVALGRMEESLAETEQALVFDPLDVSSNVHLAWHYHFARQYDRAIQQCQKMLEIQAQRPLSHSILGQAYEQKGLYAEAIGEFRRAVEYSEGVPVYLAQFAHAQAAAGNRGEAEKILNELITISRTRYVPPDEVAKIYLALEDKESALQWLERAYRERSASLINLKVDPLFDPLRSDPRYRDLLRRMGLPS